MSRVLSSAWVALAAASGLSGCRGDSGVVEGRVIEIVAILEDDLSVVCADEAAPASVRLEAFPRGCDGTDCPPVVKGKLLDCEAGASGDVKVRILEPGTYVVELLYLLGDAERRDCYAPAGEDDLVVPEDLEVTRLEWLELWAEGPCPAD